jgi:hypothetical protein
MVHMLSRSFSTTWRNWVAKFSRVLLLRSVLLPETVYWPGSARSGEFSLVLFSIFRLMFQSVDPLHDCNCFDNDNQLDLLSWWFVTPGHPGPGWPLLPLGYTLWSPTSNPVNQVRVLKVWKHLARWDNLDVIFTNELSVLQTWQTWPYPSSEWH